ncbi:hypothetical protein AB0E59_05935 [Lentzea sp. NPDC034063]|uniref:hypothetical protein n=1 Tax=unclassified Lentzea TaxID=2643253 RepID=UPI0033DA656C
MTAGNGNESAEDDPENLSKSYHVPALTSLPPTRRTRRRRGLPFALRHVVSGRPSTVWPCAQDDLGEVTGLLASWLLTAVVKIVTTYSQPGQRVLLLEPPARLMPTGLHTVRGSQGQPRSGPCAGLHEAGWTVVRLGRSVQSQTVVTNPDQEDAHLGAESGSGLAESVGSPTIDGLAGPLAHINSGPESAPRRVSSDGYDLVIAVAEPQALSWFRLADWGHLLAPAGVLAVITRGNRASHRFADPANSLVRATHSAGLLYLDRIALLRTPVRDGVLVVTTSAGHVRSRTSTRPPTTPVRHVQVHDDLLVFARQPINEGGVSSHA